MEALIRSGLASGLFYGAEVLLANGPEVQLHRAYGTFDGTRPLDKDAIFDVASLTKPVATASLLLALGLPLDSRVSHYIPAFKDGEKASITLLQLAAHLSGLPATQRFIETCTTAEDTFRALLNVPLKASPGTAVTYSCLGYMLLGKVLEAHTGQPLDALFARHIAVPAGMKDSGFRPAPSPRLVPSGIRPHNGGQPGVVNDSNAWLMGGVSGNAGLFATAADLHRFACRLLDERKGAARMFQNQAPVGHTPRSLGWEIKHAPAASCGPDFPDGAIGHTGFTGTALWMDKNSGLIAILLTNRSAISHRRTLEMFKLFRHRFFKQATVQRKDLRAKIS